MLKRIGLFLLVNLLVMLTVGVIMNLLLPYFGIHLKGGAALAVLCGLFGMGGAFISLSISRWMAKRAYNIQLINQSERDPELRSIYEIVARQSRQAGLPVPEVGIYESPDPNAFATGASKNKALVAFSTGLFRSMDRHEFEAVVGHELSHIANGDMVTMTLLTGVANTLVMFVARIAAMALDTFMRDDDGRGGLGFIGYIVVVMLLETVFFALAAIPLAAFSRAREFRADRGGAKLSSPAAMIDALRRLAEASEVKTQSDSFAMAKINSGRRLSLWSTHPSTEERIARLQRLAG